jgi:hypothetical protein
MAGMLGETGIHRTPETGDDTKSGRREDSRKTRQTADAGEDKARLVFGRGSYDKLARRRRKSRVKGCGYGRGGAERGRERVQG